MIHNRKVVVVLPSYNASRTLAQTLSEVPMDIVDELVLVDDYSSDDTLEQAKRLGIRHIIRHDTNKGYGANQKTCFDKALELGADIIILLHPDYQYSPKLVGAMCYMLTSDLYQVVLASRILGGRAMRDGMPIYKYIANRILTLFQNIFLNQKISEYHTGYRAYTADVLKSISYRTNSDGFIFDNEILSQVIMKKYTIGEISCPAKYFAEASSIRFGPATTYGLGIIGVTFTHLFHAAGLIRHRRYKNA